MAIIKCLKCGESISDKAEKCVHCGFDLKNDSVKLCPECGEELEDGATICSKCGFPVIADEMEISENQHDNITYIEVKKNMNKKTLICIIGAVIVIIALAIGIPQYQSSSYINDIEEIRDLMLKGSLEAEDCGTFVQKVWFNSIYQINDISTNEYTQSFTYFYDDFEKAINKLYDDKDFKERLSKIEENQIKVEIAMEDVKDPPEKWKDAYYDLYKLYESYTDLTNMVLSPTGSLSSFTNEYTVADAAVVDGLKKMEMYIK